MPKIKTGPKIYTYKHHRPKGTSHHDFHKVYWPYLPLLVVVGLLVFLNIKSGLINARPSYENQRVLASNSSMQPQTLLAESNAKRQDFGKKPLKISAKLTAAATAKAKDMIKRNYWSHNTPDGRTPWSFVTAAGYKYSYLGENLAAGFSSEKAIVAAWMASASHRHNLLNKVYSQVGFGLASSSDYTAAGKGINNVVVAMYGAPALATNTVKVLAASDGGSRLSKVQLASASPLSASWSEIALLAIAVGAIVVWAVRHIRKIRRVITRGEKYVLTHPMLDALLLAIAVLSVLLLQDSGVIG